jgi:hypothetical protein
LIEKSAIYSKIYAAPEYRDTIAENLDELHFFCSRFGSTPFLILFSTFRHEEELAMLDEYANNLRSTGDLL